MKAQHDQSGSAHSSPLAGRRRMPAAGPPRGHQHQQQVLVTEENLSDKEVYPSGYMSIPQIGESRQSPALAKLRRPGAVGVNLATHTKRPPNNGRSFPTLSSPP